MTTVRVTITFILIGIIIWQLGGLQEAGKVIAGMTPASILLVLIVNTLDRALMTFKWVWLLRGRGARLPFFQGMKIYCAAMVWGMFLPSTVGADAIRAFSVSRLGFDSKEVIASIVVERMGGFLSAMLLGLLSLAALSSTGRLDGQFAAVWQLGMAMLAVTILIFVSSFSQRVFDWIHGRFLYKFRNAKIMQKLRQFHLTYQAYQNNKRILAGFLGLTFGEQLMPILHSWLIAWGLGVPVSLLYLAGAIPLSILISRIPISIDGIGVFDGVFILLMSLAGISPAEAIAITLVGRILQTLSWLPWWIAHVAQSGSLQPPQPLAKEG